MFPPEFTLVIQDPQGRRRSTAKLVVDPDGALRCTDFTLEPDPDQETPR